MELVALTLGTCDRMTDANARCWHVVKMPMVSRKKRRRQKSRTSEGILMATMLPRYCLRGGPIAALTSMLICIAHRILTTWPKVQRSSVCEDKDMARVCCDVCSDHSLGVSFLRFRENTKEKSVSV